MNAAFSEIQDGAFSHLPLLQFLYGWLCGRAGGNMVEPDRCSTWVRVTGREGLKMQSPPPPKIWCGRWRDVGSGVYLGRGKRPTEARSVGC